MAKLMMTSRRVRARGSARLRGRSPTMTMEKKKKENKEKEKVSQLGLPAAVRRRSKRVLEQQHVLAAQSTVHKWNNMAAILNQKVENK